MIHYFPVNEAKFTLIPVKELRLTNSQEKAIIDEKYHEHLAKFKWCLDKGGRVVGNVDGYRYKLYRYVMLLSGQNITDKQIDHADQNKLNNTLSNLRIATWLQNARNRRKFPNKSSKYIGVSWHRTARKWVVQISHNYKSFYMGLYQNEEEAARVYDETLRRLPIEEGYKVYNFPTGIEISVPPQLKAK